MKQTGKNQEICREFVGREIFANITDFAEYLFCEYDTCYANLCDFENGTVMRCPECDEPVDSDELVSIEKEDEDGVLGIHSCCPHCEAILEDGYDPYMDYVEVDEYYIVSEFLGRKLRDRGECILPRLMGWIWGRQGGGQSVHMDTVIQNIVEEIGLIEEEGDK